MYKGKSIAVIIPCHNEAPRIGNVLKPVLKSKFADEVIVVDDESTDNSVSKVLEFDGKVKLIRNKTNIGKAHSVFKGIKESKAEIIFLIDADLENLNPKQIDYSISQMVDLELDMLLLPVGGPSKILTSLYTVVGNHILLTGQRLIKRELIAKVRLGKVTGYGLEMYLNKLAKTANWKVDAIIWKKYEEYPITPLKIKKYGLVKGIRKDVKMLSEMFGEFSPSDYLEDLKLIIKKAIK